MRTRFAPSPTGQLHVGGLRTALYAWALARGAGGGFVLRLEDTDLARSSDAAADAILADLRWAGLDWDNDGDVPKQSERLDLYNAAVDKLLADGRAYEDGDAVRFRFGFDVTFDDAVYGTIETPASNCEDFIIRKGEAGGRMPTFHLAVVVDDHDMGITHVLRGQEHLSNTPKHAALCDALGYPRPTWAHTPSIMNPGGSKMSKRDKAKAARKAAKELNLTAVPGVDGGALAGFIDGKTDDAGITTDIARHLNLDLPEIEVSDFQHAGYLAPVLCNYLALLGWNPGDDVEHFDLDFLKEHFGLDRCNRSPATFDREKLAAFNQDAILKMPADQWARRLREHWALQHPDALARLGNHFDTFAAAYHERSRTLSDPLRVGRFFFEAPTENDFPAKAVKKNLRRNEGEGLTVLRDLRGRLADAAWDAEALLALLETVVTERGLKNLGAVAQPLRCALAGNPATPEIGPTLEILGRDETLARIDRCLAWFGADS